MHSKATKINLQQGLNKLFTDPNVEKARDFLQTKARFPGSGRKEVLENCGFKLLWADHITETEPPTKEELSILREQIDPERVIIGRM